MDTITKQRSALDPSTADAIIFLNKNNKVLRPAVNPVPSVPSVPVATEPASASATDHESKQTNVKAEPEPMPTLPSMDMVDA